MKSPPVLICFCGPNGAGKSSLRRLLFEDLPIPFINADLIAAERFDSPTMEAAYEAAVLAERERQRLFEGRNSFSFETVLSDPIGAKVAFLREARESGYLVLCHFVGIASARHSRIRVAQRVIEGGHDVPDAKIDARYPRVIENLCRLPEACDELTIYDNTSPEHPYRVLARFVSGTLVEVADPLPDWIAPLDLRARRTAETRILP